MRPSVVSHIGKCKNLLDLDINEKTRFLTSFDVIILGCDGVIWNLKDIISEAPPALALLQETGKPMKFLTNNSMYNDEEYLTKLRDLGVENVTGNDILYPSKTILRFLKNHSISKTIFSLCSSRVNEMLERNGILTKTMDPSVHLNRKELLGRLRTSDKVGAVVLDTNFNITYSQLAKAHQYLKDEKCLFVVGAPDRFLPVTTRFKAMGMHGYMSLLHDNSGKDPIILGKPGPVLVNEVFEQFNITDPARVLIIGDNLKTDIEFGVLCHFKTLLVLSGVSTTLNLMEIAEHQKPDFILNNIGEFVTFFQSMEPVGRIIRPSAHRQIPNVPSTSRPRESAIPELVPVTHSSHGPRRSSSVTSLRRSSRAGARRSLSRRRSSAPRSSTRQSRDRRQSKQ